MVRLLVACDMKPKAQAIKGKLENWTLSKFKNFRTSRDTMENVKRQSTEWKKTFANQVSSKGLLSRVYKELLQLNNKETSIPVKTRAKDLNRRFSKKMYEWPIGT